MSPDSHWWGYYPGTLSSSQATATHLKIGHLKISFIGAWSSNDLSRLPLKIQGTMTLVPMQWWPPGWHTLLLPWQQMTYHLHHHFAHGDGYSLGGVACAHDGDDLASRPTLCHLQLALCHCWNVGCWCDVGGEVVAHVGVPRCPQSRPTRSHLCLRRVHAHAGGAG